MLLVDANAILRYTLNNNPDMATRVGDVMKESRIFIRYEVLAEVIYVLNKVYSLPRNEIAEGVKLFLTHPSVETESEEVLSLALKTYATVNMDFVDCVLYSFRAVYGHSVFTFDKQLNSMINKLD